MYLDFDSIIKPAFSCSSSYWFSTSSSFSIIAYTFTFNSLRASSVRFISWFHSCYSGSFSNFFLLNKCVNGWMYLGKSSGFVMSGSLLILLLSYSLHSIACVFLVLNLISWYFILQLPGHLVKGVIRWECRQTLGRVRVRTDIRQ